MTDQWKKSSHSYQNNCVEVSATPQAVRVRDSKDPNGAILTVARADWLALLSDLP